LNLVFVRNIRFPHRAKARAEMKIIIVNALLQYQWIRAMITQKTFHNSERYATFTFTKYSNISRIPAYNTILWGLFSTVRYKRCWVRDIVYGNSIQQKASWGTQINFGAKNITNVNTFLKIFNLQKKFIRKKFSITKTINIC
jgi:hypothetical protein